MHKSHLTLIAILIALIAGALALAFTNNNSPAPENRLTVSTSIFPLTDITRNIAGDSAEVIQLIPSGSSPHTYSMSPQQLSDLSASKTLFAIGHGLEPASLVSAAQGNNVPVRTVDTGIELTPFEEPEEHGHEAEEGEHESGQLDPHYWLTVPNAKIIAANIAKEMRSLDPINKEIYERNLQDYLLELDRLEEDLQQIRAGITNPSFIAIHDAWSYFARHYNLELAATYEPREGQKPTLAELRELENIIQEHNISTFYTEPQKQSSAAISLIQNELDLSIGILDPVGGIPPRESYTNLMKANMQAL